MTSPVAPLATIPVTMRPTWLVISPDGARVYVSMRDDLPGGESVGAVCVIDTETNTVAATIPIGLFPGGIAITPDGRQVYVSNWDSAHASGVLSVIDTTTDTVTRAITLSGIGGGPKGVAVTLDGRTAYVATEGEAANLERGKVTVIDTATNKITATITGSPFPTGVTITPDGRHAYVLDTDGLPGVIDTATNQAEFPFANVSGQRMAFAPGGDHAYIVRDADTLVSILDTATNRVVNLTEVNGLATDIASTPDRRHAYVSQRTRSRLSVIDTATHAVTPLPVEWAGTADALAITPSDGQRAYIADGRSRAVRVIELPPAGSPA